MARLADLPESVQVVAVEAILCGIEERRQLEESDAFEREASIASLDASRRQYDMIQA